MTAVVTFIGYEISKDDDLILMGVVNSVYEEVNVKLPNYACFEGRYYRLRKFCEDSGFDFASAKKEMEVRHEVTSAL